MNSSIPENAMIWSNFDSNLAFVHAQNRAMEVDIFHAA